jgi:hypothetical protein
MKRNYDNDNNFVPPPPPPAAAAAAMLVLPSDDWCWIHNLLPSSLTCSSLLCGSGKPAAYFSTFCRTHWIGILGIVLFPFRKLSYVNPLLIFVLFKAHKTILWQTDTSILHKKMLNRRDKKDENTLATLCTCETMTVKSKVMFHSLHYSEFAKTEIRHIFEYNTLLLHKQDHTHAPLKYK